MTHLITGSIYQLRHKVIMNKIIKSFLQTIKVTQIICPMCNGECSEHRPYANSCLVLCNNCNRCFCSLDNNILIEYGERCIKCGAGEKFLIKKNLDRGCFYCRINWQVKNVINFVNVEILETIYH